MKRSTTERQTRVKDIMRKETYTIDHDASLKEAAKAMRTRNTAYLPVRDHRLIVGIITDRDIAIRGSEDGLDPSSTRVRHIMTKGAVTCRDDLDTGMARHLMEQRQAYRLLVVNKDDIFVGCLSRSDL